MPEYICEKCHQDFKQKNDYIRHINKKYPCITQEELKKGITEDESLKKLESFFLKIRDLLRDNENITGDKALDVITDFLFLRLLNYQIKGETKINIISKKYNEKIKIEKEEYDLDEYKKYFKWDELMNIVNNIDKDSQNHEQKLLLTNVIQHIIFNGIFKLNENTKDIYRNRRFYVQKTTTLMKLLKEYNKINFEDYDVDIKGKAYELTLQKEGATNKDFSQFFTPRWIDKYMVEHAEIEINDDGSYTKLMDPACGTAGILSEYISHVKKLADKKDIIIDKNIAKYIYGNEIVDDTLKIAHMNILLKSGIYNKSLKCQDFLEVGCQEYSDEKFDGHIIMNPPFALTKTYDLSDKELKNIFHTQTKSGTMLFLMSALNTIEKGKQLIMVSPNGKEIFNKNKEYVNIRKHVIENSNLYKIAILPDGAFKPYTGVQTLVLMIKKGEKTKEIQFVKVNKNKDDTYTETKVCKVKYDEMVKKEYSWNYKEYYEEEKIKYDNIIYKKICDICTISSGVKFGIPENFFSDIPTKWKYIRISDLKNYGIDETNIKYFNEDGFNKTKHIFFEKNDLYFSIVGTIGSCGFINDNNSGASYSGNIVKISNFSEDINFKFVMYYFNSFSFKNILNNKITTNVQPKISISDLNELQIPIPPIEVQNLIVKELDSMYKQKEDLISAIKLNDEFKKIYFDDLLKKYKNNKNVKLGEICEIKTGKNKPSDGLEDGKKYPYFGTGGITGYTNEYLFDGEYLMTPRNGSVGTIFMYNGKSFPSDHVFVIKPNNNILLKFLNYSLLTNNLAYHKTGAIIPNITKEIIESSEIKIVSKIQQEEIVKEMEKHDELIKSYQEQIKLLDIMIKKRFDEYLQRCKDSKDNKDKPKEELDKEIESESEVENSPKKESKKIKVKSKKLKEVSDLESESEVEEKPKKKVSKNKLNND